MMVVSGEGEIRWASERVADMVARTPAELVGDNVADIVPAEDVADYLDLLRFARSHTPTIMGPVRFRYRHPESGAVMTTDAWVENRLDDPVIEGFVVQLVEEAARDGLTDAVMALAAEAPLGEVLTLAAGSLRGHPVVATGGILLSGEHPSVHGPADLPPSMFGGAALAGPWDMAMMTQTPQVVADHRALPAELARRAVDHGLHAVWSWPVIEPGSGRVDAAVTAWRARPGAPSPNQRLQLDRTASVVALAMGRHRQLRALRDAAHRDPLTGLANRSSLERLRGEDFGCGGAVLFIDLDGFKSVNDALGHVVGDEVLRQAAARLSSAVRTTDHLVRLGGDEFVVVCRPPCGPAATVGIADRILDALHRPISLANGEQTRIGATIGVAHGEADDDLDHLLSRADQAMLEAKRSGRGRWQLAASPTA